MPKLVNPKTRPEKQELLTEAITVAVLGSGGREHALTRQIAASPLCKEVYVLPGNAGMLQTLSRRFGSKVKTHATAYADFEALSEKLKELGVELVVVGPDDLLAAGVVDVLEKNGFAVFGPQKSAARIESSKAFAKEVMEQASVPTARHEVLSAKNASEVSHVAERIGGYPIVLKYDGLALGKGVQTCVDSHDAEAFLKEVFENQKFTRQNSKSENLVVAEEFLEGHEVSIFALSDGEHYVILEPACDHKRLSEENKGPNTGGMGAFSPVPWLGVGQLSRISEQVFVPVLKLMREKGTPFKGLLYAGLMVREDKFWVLEFNARFGDPETQAILPRLESDLLPLLYGVAVSSLDRHLNAYPMRWSKQSCVNIVLVSKGYPEKPETGMPISLADASILATEHLYFAGVKASGEGLITSGGRVVSVSSLGVTLDDARQKTLNTIKKISFAGMHFRKDIGSVARIY